MKTTIAAVLASLLLAGAADAQKVVSELSRHQAQQHYRRGIEFLTGERYDLAAQEFSTSIKHDPLMTLAHYGLGQAYMGLQRYASAVQAFSGCRQAYETIAAIRDRDLAESQRLELDEINELRDSIRRMQTSVKTSAGTAFRIEKRLEELETLRRGRQSGAHVRVPAEVLLALGSAYYRNGKPAEAEREWLAAVAVDASLGEAHNNLAAHYLVTGRKAEAEQALLAAERARFRVNPQLRADIANLR